jgi:dihydroorotase
VVAAIEQGLRLGWIQEATPKFLEEFLRGRGRRFYKIEDLTQERCEQRIILEKKGERIPDRIKSKNGTIEVVPFRSGEEVMSLWWK